MTTVHDLIEGTERKAMVETHRFQHNGVRILLDVNRVNFFEINDTVSDVIDAMEQRLTHEGLMSRHSREAVENALADLEENSLFDHNFDVDEAEQVDLQAEKIAVENLVILVSNDCNLRCRYCFAGTGPYKGTRSLMNERTGKRTLEWLFEQSADKKQLNVHFFGGEPLLNAGLISVLSDYACDLEQRYKKRVFLNICTNGTILNDDIMTMIKRHEMGVQISIDGPKDIHDSSRCFPGGDGSYEIIARNVERIVREVPADRVIARATISRGAVHSVNEIVAHVFNMGFSRAFFVPAMGCGQWVVTQEDLVEFCSQYNRLAETYIEWRRKGKHFNLFPFAAEVNNVSNGIKKLYGCGAGMGFASVSVDGKISPCMRFTDKEEYCLGNVNEGLDFGRRVRLIRRTVDRRPACSACWARYLCGGACIALSPEKNREMEEPDPLGCQVSKQLATLAMYVCTVLTRDGIEPVGKSIGDFDFLRRRFA